MTRDQNHLGTSRGWPHPQQVVRDHQVGRPAVSGDQVSRPEVRGDETGRQSPAISCLKEGDIGHSLREECLAASMGGTGDGGHCSAGLVPQRLLSGHGGCSLAQVPGWQPPLAASAGLDCHASCHDA